MRIYTGCKTVIYYLVIIFAALVAYQIFPKMEINDRQSLRFSPERVAKDINIISKRPHSIQHPKERKVVGEYLFHRLQQMGGSTQVFEYDSIECKFGGYIDIANIFATFEPHQVTDSTQYLLLIAHYDSRYSTKVLKDTVYSYGAADDGYGLGVILESVNQALKYREYWKQGIKVVFTDSEEHDLDGMKNLYKHHKYLLDNVNLVMNIEARGVKGPALLFETSPGNKKLMELYKEAERPYTYSLTSLVYRILPNKTDFSVVKDSIPGMNFSVIDNLKYYHTDLDNYSNISLRSLQHYGLQLEPIIYRYLISSEYSYPDSLKDTEDSVFFTLPIFGLFTFSKTGYILLNMLFVLIFALAFVYLLFIKKINVRDILKSLKYVALFFIGAFVVGELIAFCAALVNGEKFGLLSVKYVKYDYVISIISILVLFLWMLIFFRLKERGNAAFPYSFLFGAQIFALILSLVLCVVFLENFFVFIPFALSVAAFILSVFSRSKWVYVISAFFISLLGFSFLYCFITALSFGALGVLLSLSYLYISILVAQYYCYKRNCFII
jgi:hypothetical protein